MSSSENKVIVPNNSIGREKSSTWLLDNLGRFSDGTPLSEESIKAWRQQSLEEKVQRNVAQLNQKTIRWDALYQKSVASPLDQPSDLFVSEGVDPQNMDSSEDLNAEAKDARDSAVNLDSSALETGGTRPVTIFLHVPKAGGTTLEYLLSKNYSINRSIHINAPELEKKPYLLFKHSALPALVMGHHKISSILYQLIDRPIIHLTMLRDPIRRAISYYDYRRSGTRHKLYEMVREMTLREFVESGQFIELENAQTRRLLGTLQKTPKNSDSGWAKMSDADMTNMLDTAKQALHDRISLFGITEEYTRFLLMGRRMLGWTDLYYNRRNISQKKTNLADVEPSVLDLIRQRNQVDIALFDYAKQVFDERCSQLGITQEKVEQYETLNSTYQDLLSSAKQLSRRLHP